MLGKNGWCVMRILVLSDSHGELGFMRSCLRAVKPDAVVHLGDYYDDGAAIAREHPHLRVIQLPGNCDHYRRGGEQPEVLCYDVCGARLFMTHGHTHRVKLGIGSLVRDGEESGADAVLYGHTHCADCHREASGLWVLNPGSSGAYGGSCGVIETDENGITACYLLRQADVEEKL